ncbi:MAG: hypothetical protein ABI921_05480, partial [Panacibacter sp.]
ADSARYNDFLKTGNDSAHAKAMLDSGMAHISEDIEQANLILGLGWNFDALKKEDSVVLNKNVCDSAKFRLLSQNADPLLPSYLKQRDSLAKKIVTEKLHLDSLKKEITGQTAVLNNYSTDTVFKSALVEIKPKLDLNKQQYFKDSIKFIRESYLLEETKDSISKTISGINTLTGKSFLEINSVKANSKSTQLAVYGKRSFTTTEKFFYVIGQLPKSGSRLIGFIITGLMLSLGAPFWFDLLRKLVALRGSGVKPEEKKDVQDTTALSTRVSVIEANPTSIITGSKSPLEVAVESVANKLSRLTGIINLEEGFIKENNKKEEAIEVYVIDEDTKVKAREIVGDKYLGYSVNYIINSHAVTHDLQFGNTISNETFINGKGTLGCFVKTDNAVYLVSCWHVLKGNHDWHHISGPSQIRDSEDKNIAILTDGSLTNIFDIGFAKITDVQNVSNGFKNAWRSVTKADAFAETDVSFSGSSSGRNIDAKIYKNIVKEKWLKYPDNMFRKLEDLFSITRYEGDKRVSPSKAGDSGSLVIDKNGFPLGIIVGGDDEFTYVCKFSNILDKDCIYKEYNILF